MSLNSLKPVNGSLKVLVCSDSSPTSLNALTFTIVHLLQQNDILQVFSALDSSDTTDAHESVEEFRRDKMIEFHDFVSRTLSSVQKENKFEIKCVYSKDVKHCLLEHVVKDDFGMVVVGAKGKSLAKGFVMGSTAQYLSNSVKIPTLVYRDPGHAL